MPSLGLTLRFVKKVGERKVAIVMMNSEQASAAVRRDGIADVHGIETRYLEIWKAMDCQFCGELVAEWSRSA